MAGPARWRELLGDDLADRVAAMATANGRQPATVCVAAVREVVERYEAYERRRAATAKARTKCQHPDKDRRGLRCGACGAKGLPAL